MDKRLEEYIASLSEEERVRHRLVIEECRRRSSEMSDSFRKIREYVERNDRISTKIEAMLIEITRNSK